MPASSRAASSGSSRATRTAPHDPLPPANEPDAPITRQQLTITASILTALSLAALDSSVVGTAMPTIIGQLGGLSEHSWVFSGYLLASTTTVPLFSKLADIYGRKPIFLLGLIVFVISSIACGFATSMVQ